jgi:Putative Flp pilus-assembly TadE/G-like
VRRPAGGGRPPVTSERGSVTVFVVVMVVPMVLMAALAFDGGQILTARRQAIDTAQNAALAGAQAVSGPAVRHGGLDVAAGPVAVAAESYLDRNDATGKVVVGGNEVTVTVTSTVELTLLPLVGITSRTVTGTGRAELERGINQADVVGRP